LGWLALGASLDDGDSREERGEQSTLHEWTLFD
jgi:hypothetical protein